jgi:hypothetical protein
MMITPHDSAPAAPPQMPASTWNIQAPYDPGIAGHVDVHGDMDPGGGDKTAGTVEGAVAAAQARQRELESDTFGQGSVIGDIMALPGDVLGAYYDPPRDYGGSQ